MAYKVINGKVVKVQNKNKPFRSRYHRAPESSVYDFSPSDIVAADALASRGGLMRSHVRNSVDTDRPNKGVFGKDCNRTHCQQPPAYWYNFSTCKYYCDECAHELNTDRFNRKDSLEIWGHDLCVKVDAPVTADNEDAIHAKARTRSGGTVAKEEVAFITPMPSTNATAWIDTLRSTMQALNIAPPVLDMVDYPDTRMKDIPPNYDVICASHAEAIKESNRGVAALITQSASESSSAAEYEDLRALADKFLLPPFIQMRSLPVTEKVDATVVGGALEYGDGELSIVDPTLGSHDVNAQLFFNVDWAEPLSDRSVVVTIPKNRHAEVGSITEDGLVTFSMEFNYPETGNEQSEGRINRNGVVIDTETSNLSEYSEKKEGGSDE